MINRLPSEYLELYWVPYPPRTKEEQCLLTAFGAYDSSLNYLDKVRPILQKLTGCEFPGGWNDSHAKEEVLAVARLAEMKLGLRPMEMEAEEAEVVSLA